MTSYRGLVDSNGKTKNRSMAVRKLLAEGPATSAEIAAALSITPLAAQTAVSILLRQGFIRAYGTIRNHAYELTPFGMAALRRDRRQYPEPVV